MIGILSLPLHSIKLSQGQPRFKWEGNKLHVLMGRIIKSVWPSLVQLHIIIHEFIRHGKYPSHSPGSPESHPITALGSKSSIFLSKSSPGIDEALQAPLDMKSYKLGDKLPDSHKLSMQSWDKDLRIDIPFKKQGGKEQSVVHRNLKI